MLRPVRQDVCPTSGAPGIRQKKASDVPPPSSALQATVPPLPQLGAAKGAAAAQSHADTARLAAATTERAHPLPPGAPAMTSTPSMQLIPSHAGWTAHPYPLRAPVSTPQAPPQLPFAAAIPGHTPEASMEARADECATPPAKRRKVAPRKKRVSVAVQTESAQDLASHNLHDELRLASDARERAGDAGAWLGQMLGEADFSAFLSLPDEHLLLLMEHVRDASPTFRALVSRAPSRRAVDYW